MYSRSGDRSVLGITLPVGYLAMSLHPKFLTLMLSCLEPNPPLRVYVVPREQMNSEGAFWKDPPGYFEQLVYPAYVDGHRDMFTVRRMHASLLTSWQVCSQNAQDGDVEGGSPLSRGLVFIEPLQMGMDDVIERCCGELVSVLRRPLTTE